MKRFALGISRLLSRLVAWLALPIFLFKGIVSEKLRRNFFERFTLGRWSKQRPVKVWVHAASLGELVGVKPVLAGLVKHLGSAAEIQITTTSNTGREWVEKNFALSSCLLPYDLPLLISRAIRKTQPKLFILFETELWPNLLHGLLAREIPIIIVNGRISDHTVADYQRLKLIFKPLLSRISAVFVQTLLDRKRFLELGVPDEVIVVSGSTKYDETVSDELKQQCLDFRSELELPEGAPVFVAGSVREGEEEIVIRAYKIAKVSVPDLRMIIAPRHPERFETVARLLGEYRVTYERRSLPRPFAHVTLLDTIGELKRAYGIANSAFVGGTLVPIGGHNPMEPAMFGCPVITGPHLQNVRDIAGRLESVEGLVQVQNEQDLAEEIVRLATDIAYWERRSESALGVYNENLGASELVLEKVREMLK